MCSRRVRHCAFSCTQGFWLARFQNRLTKGAGKKYRGRITRAGFRSHKRLDEGLEKCALAKVAVFSPLELQSHAKEDEGPKGVKWLYLTRPATHSANRLR